MRVGLKGFAPDELEPRTSDGELVADLLASAGAQFESSSRRSHDSAASSAAAGQWAASSSADSASAGACPRPGLLGQQPPSSTGGSASLPVLGQQARQSPGRLKAPLHVARI